MSAKDAITAREAAKRPKPVIGRTATKTARPAKPKASDVPPPEPEVYDLEAEPEPEPVEAEPEETED